MDREPFGDALTDPFWEAASRHELVVQQCRACGTHQFYPRPFCLTCDAEAPGWAKVSGAGTIYSLTRIWRQAFPEHPVPYIVALLDLDEGPRLLATVRADRIAIGDRVVVDWQARDNAPPLPVFVPLARQAA